MNANIAAIAYLVSGVLFILALRGLSSPETSRQGNTFGMIGMALAIGVTLLTLWTSGALDTLTAALILGGVVVGGGGGALIAGRVQMTQMPQLVAAFHSLVGMAACLVAIGAVYAPESFGIATATGTTLLGLAFALIFTRTGFPAKRLLRVLTILPIITPPFVIGLALILLFEGVTMWVIRDGLALNILMLLWPLEAVRVWQAGG